MKLKNTTKTWSDRCLRKVIAWVCREIELPISEVRQVAIGNCSRGYSGRAWETMRIYCAIGQPSSFPSKSFIYPGRTSEDYRSPAIADRWEALVAILAHELTHLRDYLAKRNKPMIRALRRGPGELNTMFEERRVHGLFVANREAFIAEWREVPEPKSGPTLQERRFTKVANALERWQRKAKLAATKVRMYKQKVRYYEHAIAAKRSTNA